MGNLLSWKSCTNVEEEGGEEGEGEDTYEEEVYPPTFAREFRGNVVFLIKVRRPSARPIGYRIEGFSLIRREEVHVLEGSILVYLWFRRNLP